MIPFIGNLWQGELFLPNDAVCDGLALAFIKETEEPPPQMTSLLAHLSAEATSS